MSSDGDPFLATAAALAHEIANSAIWADGRCNWMGALPGDETRPASSVAIHAALGPDLYAGTSGVALFLAEAAAKIDDARLRVVALGAIRHALGQADRIDPGVRDGLYAGWIGLALAANRVGKLLDAEPLLAGAREQLLSWRRSRVPSAAFDVAGGCAGAVAGLLALADLVEEPWLVESATRLGEDLVARADVSSAGWSWPAPGRRSMHNLCGFSHGAAGIGHALLELYHVTHEARFLEAGKGAFDYERSWFDHRTGTWPDLRGVGRRVGRDAPAPSAPSWCHGAPGIALSRIRACQLLGPAAGRGDADAAITATMRLACDLRDRAADDFCLCHGATGVADALLYASATGGAAADVYEPAVDIGLLGIQRHHESLGSFPCGVPQGTTPSLFLGLAGIGLFYLRLGDPSLPTPLLVHRPCA